MLPDKKIGCHRLVRKCHDGVVKHHCQLWMQVRGVDPQTGTTVDKWGCADAFMPMLVIENAQMSRQTGAAVESLRNEITGAKDQIRGLIGVLGNARRIGQQAAE
jgi:hypothetical protein